MVILGQAYEFGTDDFTEGIDYIKVLNLSDGTTKLLFLQLYPEDIHHLVAVPGKGVLIGIDKWLVLWDAVDPEVVRWRVRMDTPKSLTVIGSDRFLVIGKDMRSLYLHNMADAKLISKSTLDTNITGVPLFYNGLILIPTTNGIVSFSTDLQVSKILYKVDLSEGTELRHYDDGLLLVGAKKVTSIR